MEHGRRIRHGTRKRDLFHHDAVALGLELPRRIAAAVFLVGGEDFVAGLHVNAVGDVVVGFGGVADERDLVAGGSDEFGERIAKFVPRSVAPDRIVLWIGVVHFFCLVIAIEYSFQDGRGARSDGAIVEINLIGRNQELFADAGPIGISVALVERGGGQLLWDGGEARKKRIVEERRAGNAGSSV